MFNRLTPFESSLFDEFKRLEQEIDDLFARWPWPIGIRSAARGAFPPVNIGATSDEVDAYLFVPGIDPKTLDISLQQNVLSVSGERKLPRTRKPTITARSASAAPSGARSHYRKTLTRIESKPVAKTVFCISR